MNSADNRLVVNPRDDLIQEINALQIEKKYKELKAKEIATLEQSKHLDSLKKGIYEWSFRRLVKKYFKLEIEDLANLNRDKLERLENLVYEMAKIKFRRLKILLGLIPVAGWTFLLLMRYDSTFLTTKDLPLAKLCLLHDWYKKNFGSVAGNILYGSAGEKI